MEQLICIGCGVEIQTEDKQKEGYAPPSSLEKEEVICQRCFRLRNYNEIAPVSLTADDFLKILHSIGEKDALIVKMVDIFDFNGSWIDGLHRFVGKQPILLIANKVDVLPKVVNRNRLIHWMRAEAKRLGLKPVDVALISAHTGEGVEEAMELIEQHRKQKDVYVVGTTNVGKSTFINKIIETATGEGEVITTSHFPGTTLGLVEIPLADGQYMIDTPGVINDHQIVHYLNPKELSLTLPKKELKPKVYQLNEQQTIFIGGFARFDFEQGSRNAFTFYVSNQIPLHRTKLENADELYDNHKGKMLAPPSIETLEAMPPFTKYQYSIKEPTDIVISGLGWITVQQPNVVVSVHAPKGIAVLVRPSII
ncbi:ribosome biogenesis GTPase YqeH [Savagea sp. SN6]|uniref:Ribosome biogenesis GTPase YqeH n=1 Tax=Savagea serpentis TaxID=2785297 RepID=A0A8J7KDK2_9BACL|nr:ribosome biogenesis GTPase YqeH [Savagea serpentis]MBF4500141.1 ribosome biogenesis GTPase YqeH [Savagea serpentis]